MRLRLWQRILWRGLDALVLRRGFRQGRRCACEDESLWRSVGCRADEEKVEAKAGEQLREHGARCAGAVFAEDPMVTGRALNFHSGAGGGGLKDL